MKKILFTILSLVLTCCCFGCNKPKETPPEKEDEVFMYPKKENVIKDRQYNDEAPILFDEALWAVPNAVRYGEGDVGDVKAYFLDSTQNTKIFVYVGIPKTAAKESKVPGVVLVHGGGGTAFYEWVNIWVEKGYAAIAMDTEGNMPVSDSKMENNLHKKSIHPSGPANTAFSDKNLDPNKQWVYHAIASAIVSNSFLGSFENVDSSNIGVTGISYGGLITANVVGYDDRFAFAVPVYGAVANKGTDTAFGKLTANPQTDIWDGKSILKNSRTPILFVNSNKDEHFSPLATSDCAKASKYSETVIITNLLHSHVHGSAVSQIFFFADNITKGTAGMSKITSQPSKGSAAVTVYLYPNTTVFDAEIMYTQDSEINNFSTWKPKAAAISGNSVTAKVPEGATYFYLNVIDSSGNQVSTNVVNNV